MKIIPLTFFAVVFHVIFFLVGYSRGSINFTETDNSYSYDGSEGTLIFFSVLISILTLIIWCVYYFKNNALKSYYPKNNFSLFKEWILMFFGSILLVTFLVSYFYGKETRVRSYYSESEAKKRCEILAMGSFFVDGPYDRYKDYAPVDTVANDTTITSSTAPISTAAQAVKENDFFVYKGETYSFNSLLNKNINSYSFFEPKKDSIYKARIKNWLVSNQKDSILNLFSKYLAIAKDHNLKASINPKQWLDYTYDFPKFEKYKNIGTEEKDIYYQENNGFNNHNADQYVKREKDGNHYLYNKYYVPEKQLHHSYDTISDSFETPIISWQSFLIPLYIALGISLLLLSFRITSGKNWLIALISLGVFNIVIGIITAIFGSEYVYLSCILLLFTFTILYFLTIISRKKGKGISGITVNVMLWMLPSFAPIVYYILLQIAREISGYNSTIGLSKDITFPKITYFQDTDVIFNLVFINIAFVILLMVLFSRKIKQWRGIAEY